MNNTDSLSIREQVDLLSNARIERMDTNREKLNGWSKEKIRDNFDQVYGSMIQDMEWDSMFVKKDLNYPEIKERIGNIFLQNYQEIIQENTQQELEHILKISAFRYLFDNPPAPKYFKWKWADEIWKEVDQRIEEVGKQLEQEIDIRFFLQQEFAIDIDNQEGESKEKEQSVSIERMKQLLQNFVQYKPIPEGGDHEILYEYYTKLYELVLNILGLETIYLSYSKILLDNGAFRKGFWQNIQELPNYARIDYIHINQFIRALPEFINHIHEFIKELDPEETNGKRYQPRMKYISEFMQAYQYSLRRL